MQISFAKLIIMMSYSGIFTYYLYVYFPAFPITWIREPLNWSRGIDDFWRRSDWLKWVDIILQTLFFINNLQNSWIERL